MTANNSILLDTEAFFVKVAIHTHFFVSVNVT
jgi:hypothetical protein